MAFISLVRHFPRVLGKTTNGSQNHAPDDNFAIIRPKTRKLVCMVSGLIRSELSSRTWSSAPYFVSPGRIKMAEDSHIGSADVMTTSNDAFYVQVCRIVLVPNRLRRASQHVGEPHD